MRRYDNGHYLTSPGMIGIRIYLPYWFLNVDLYKDIIRFPLHAILSLDKGRDIPRPKMGVES
jgi:hypothetical protein